MPTYELSLLLRVMPREEMVTCLKRTASEIFKRGGFIRAINNIGKQPTPYKMSGEYGPYREGHYFIIEYEGATSDTEGLKKVYERDVDVIKPSIYRQNEPEDFPCLLDDELKPPAYRKEVQEMIEIARRKAGQSKSLHYKHNTGLNYYPFQR